MFIFLGMVYGIMKENILILKKCLLSVLFTTYFKNGSGKMIQGWRTKRNMASVTKCEQCGNF